MLDREINQMTNAIFSSANMAVSVANLGINISDEILKILDTLIDNAIRYDLDKKSLQLIEEQLKEDNTKGIKPCRVIFSDKGEAEIIKAKAMKEGINCVGFEIKDDTGTKYAILYSGRYQHTMNKLLAGYEMNINSELKDIYRKANHNDELLGTIKNLNAETANFFACQLEANNIEYAFSNDGYPTSIVVLESDMEKLKNIRDVVTYAMSSEKGQLIKDSMKIEENNLQSIYEHLIELKEFKEGAQNAGYIVVNLQGEEVAQIDKNTIQLTDTNGITTRIINPSTNENKAIIQGIVGMQINNGLIPLTKKELEDYYILQEKDVLKAGNYLKEKAFKKNAIKELTSEEKKAIEAHVYEVQRHIGWSETKYDYSYCAGIACQINMDDVEQAINETDCVEFTAEEKAEFANEYQVEYKEANYERLVLEEKIFNEQTIDYQASDKNLDINEPEQS